MDRHVKSHPAVEVRNLNWDFGSMEVLRNINTVFDKGMFTSIIGPNGSGKTTLLRGISSWLKPERSTIYVNGQDILSLSSKDLAKHMAFVPQNTQIDFDFTALDVVLMGRMPHIDRFKDEDKDDLAIAEESMILTNTWHLKDRPVTNLSGGERQRVIIARALAQRAEILLLDEPISYLDIYHQIEVLDLIKELQLNKSITVIVVLHDLNLAIQYSDTIILMENGTIRCSGYPSEVVTRENIREVYGVDVYMTKHPTNGLPYFIPVSAINGSRGKTNMI